MNELAYRRIIWQIPVLIFMVAAIIPSVSWYSDLFGPWPLWLLASPAMIFAMGCRRRVYSSPSSRPAEGAQVLVFPAVNSRLRVGMAVHRRAA